MFALAMALCVGADAAEISTVVGGGGSGHFGTRVSLQFPKAMASDGRGNLYYVSANRVFRLDRNGLVTMIAGGGSSDFGEVGGIAVDAMGNLYVSDVTTSKVHRVGPDGVVATVAGTGSPGFAGDGGPAAAAQLRLPRGLATDAEGNLYIADTGNARVRRMVFGGAIDTFAGGGAQYAPGAGLPATELTLDRPRDVAIDHRGDLLVADTGNERILRITPVGMARTIAGDDVPSDDEADNAGSVREPAGIAAADDGTVYYTERYGHRVRMIAPDGTLSVLAGRYSAGSFSGDGSEALYANLQAPYGIAVDTLGNVLVADSENHRIRRIATGSEDPDRIGTGVFTPFAGVPVASKPGGVVVGDITGDGRNDVVVAASWHSGAADVANDYHAFVYVQRADGTLAAPVKIDYRGLRSDWNYAEVELADMNGDGLLDVVIADQGGVSVIPGSRNGQFQALRTTKGAPGAGELDLVMMDVDQDGKQDAVVNMDGSSSDSRGVWLYRGTGQGGVLAPERIEAAGYSLSGAVDLASGDLNGDGRPDLVVVLDSGRVILLRQAPSGGFEPGVGFELGVRSAEIGDLDGDGREDIVLSRANGPYYDMRIYGQTKAGSLSYREQISTVEAAVSMRIVDVDGDRKNDLLVSLNGSQEIGYYQNTPLGLAEKVGYLVPSVLDMAIGDVNGDGCRDVAGASVYELVLLHGTNCIKAPPGNDFDGDGVSDLLWREVSRGINAIWRSADYGRRVAVTAVSNVAWTVAGTADFDGDGREDILWRNMATGANVIWKHASHADQLPVLTVGNLDWKVAATADFDGDGRADILWRNLRSGANVVWRSGNGATQTAVKGVSNLAWEVVAAADFDGDGRADILWRNVSSGANVIWNGADYANQRSVTGVKNLAWMPAGAADFDGDGRADILWRNTGTGDNVIWRSGDYVTQQPVRAVTDTAWSVAGTGDYDGDGRADILWRHATSGNNAIWRAADYRDQQKVTTVSGSSWRIMD